MWGPVIVIGVFIIGYLVGRSGNPSTPTVGQNTSTEKCKEACDQWDKRRQERCIAQAAEANARARAESLRTEFLGALAAAATLAGAAVAAFFIPFIGPAVAKGLAIAAGIAFAAADVLAGMLVAADADVAAKAAATIAALDAESQAREQVKSNCTFDEANACLTRTAPC